MLAVERSCTLRRRLTPIPENCRERRTAQISLRLGAAYARAEIKKNSDAIRACATESNEFRSRRWSNRRHLPSQCRTLSHYVKTLAAGVDRGSITTQRTTIASTLLSKIEAIASCNFGHSGGSLNRHLYSLRFQRFFLHAPVGPWRRERRAKPVRWVCLRANIAATISAPWPSASKWTRKRFASWGRKAHCCARSSPPPAQKRQVLECQVLYRSGAPDTIRTCDLCLWRATLILRAQYGPKLSQACGSDSANANLGSPPAGFLALSPPKLRWRLFYPRRGQSGTLLCTGLVRRVGTSTHFSWNMSRDSSSG
jgi:hypothetical protein